MKSVKIKRIEVLETIKKNRENHEKIFTEALEGYRKAAIAHFEKQLEAASKGKKFEVFFNALMPRNETKSYDTVIKMLEWDVQEFVDLDAQSFQQYVLDEWHWRDAFLNSTKAYSATANTIAESIGL